MGNFGPKRQNNIIPWLWMFSWKKQRQFIPEEGFGGQI
jgi:hypothetical protein